jgi:hypothetical protein
MLETGSALAQAFEQGVTAKAQGFFVLQTATGARHKQAFLAQCRKQING